MRRDGEVTADRSSSIVGTAPERSFLRLASFDRPRAWYRLWARTHVRWLSGIVVLAFALRLALVIAVQPDPTDPRRFDDTVYYDASAQALADGHGYAIPRLAVDVDPSRAATGSDEKVLVATARWPPGYPLILAGIYFFFGHTLMLARLLNVVLGTATVLLVYLLGCRLADRRVGLLGAFLFALYPSHILFSTLLLTEVLFTFLLVAILLLALAWGERGRPAWWRLFALGVIIGLAAMVRGEAILLPLAVALAYGMIWRSPWRATASAALMVAGLALVFIPWTVRNAIQLDSPIIGTTGAGGALIQAHHPVADGKPDLYVEARSQAELAHIPYPEREVELYNNYVEDSLRYMREHPGREVQLIGLRFWAMFDRDDSGVVWLRLQPPVITEGAADVLTVLSQTHYLIVTLLAAASAPLWLSLRHPTKAMLMVVAAYYIALHVVLFVGEARYHVPLMPLIALWAAAGLAFAWHRRPRFVKRVAEPA